MTTDTDFLSDEEIADLEEEIAGQRRRELAVEHLLFQTIGYLASRHPGLLDHLEESLPHLGDSADDGTKDDEAVRDVARLFLHGLRAKA